MSDICIECKDEICDDGGIFSGDNVLWHVNDKNGFLCIKCYENIITYGSTILISYFNRLFKLKFFNGYIYDTEFKKNRSSEIKDREIFEGINEIVLNHYLKTIDPWRGFYKTKSKILEKIFELDFLSNLSGNCQLFKFNNKIIQSFNKSEIPLIRITHRTTNTFYNIIEYYTVKKSKDLGNNIVDKYKAIVKKLIIITL
ncbi:MAG: hypothetical protein ACFFAN_01480 [Promethearchaeota archaeon]